MSFFQFVHVEMRIVATEHLAHLGGEEMHLVHRMVAKEKSCLGTILQNDEDTPIHEHVNSRSQQIHHLQGLFHALIARNIHKQPILCQSGVERIDGIHLGRSQLCIIALEHFGILLGKLTQGTCVDSILCGGSERFVVHNKHEIR